MLQAPSLESSKSPAAASRNSTKPAERAHVSAPPQPAAPQGQICVPGVDAEELEAIIAGVEVLGDEALAQLGGFRLPVGFRLSIVVPVFNELQHIDEILRRVHATPVPKEIIVVDDYSTDGTRERLFDLADQYQLCIILHDRNQGKGAAVRTGMAACGGQVVLVQDADLEYDPSEYPQLIRPLVEGKADVVYGSRYLGTKIQGQKWTHRLANSMLTGLSNACTGLQLTDMETCYKAFRRDSLKGIEIEQSRFGIEPELTAKIARKKLRIQEVPVSYCARGIAEGKKIRLKDAFQAIYCILRYSVFRR
jgi:glycosyltransferase involved in cell wall biosynthesis